MFELHRGQGSDIVHQYNTVSILQNDTLQEKNNHMFLFNDHYKPPMVNPWWLDDDLPSFSKNVQPFKDAGHNTIAPGQKEMDHVYW